MSDSGASSDTDDGAWERDVLALWDGADREDPAAVLSAAQALAARRPAGDAAAVYEVASAHDFAGDEAVAVTLYERALDHGLQGSRRDQAIIQLASSLRNVGRPRDAVALLESETVADGLAPAAHGFRALALHDLGRHGEALRAAIAGGARTQYSRVLASYADDLEGCGADRR